VILVVYRLLHLLSKDGWKMVCLQVLSCFDTHKKNGQKNMVHLFQLMTLMQHPKHAAVIVILLYMGDMSSIEMLVLEMW